MQIKLEYILILIFLTVLSAIAIGDFNIRLATEDYRLSGVSHSFIFLYNDIYNETVLSNFSKINFQILTIISVLISELFNIQIKFIVYFLTIFGNVLFYLIFYIFSKLILKSSEKSFFTLITFIAFGITYNNLSIMGTDGAIQVFPDTNIYAWSLILLSTFFLIKKNFNFALITLALLPFIHIGHFFLFSLSVVSFFIFNFIMKKNYISFYYLFIYSLFCIFIVLLFKDFEVVKDFSDYEMFFFDYLKDTVGHANPLLYESIFPKVLISYIAVVSFAYLGALHLFTKNQFIYEYKIIILISLFYSFFLFLLTIIIPFYNITLLSKIWFLIPARASVYSQIFIFPLVGLFFFELLGSHKNKIIKLISIIFIIISSLISSFGLLIMNIPLLLASTFEKNYKSIITIIFIFILLSFSLFLYFGEEYLGIMFFGPLLILKDIFFENNTTFFRSSFLIIFLSRVVACTLILLATLYLIKGEKFKNFTYFNLISAPDSRKLVIIFITCFTFINSLQKMSATLFDSKRQEIYQTQEWINENINQYDKIITDQYIFSFSGISNHAIIYPSISTYLPFRIINQELEAYQENMEEITNKDYSSSNLSNYLNSKDIKNHDEALNDLNTDQIKKLSTFHKSYYFLTKNNYKTFDLLYNNDTYNIYKLSD